ncbi:hypothetical protein MNBD_GAMMA07-2502 [hydrothermal vent metagenome]|uniref:Uncharacterized protein n=1 Tax=hydrothermal vent metagenome TaxID=652676 RepID=A0A3B0X8A0_9ZZZZ
MELTICSKLCTECPFSAASPKGWLGPHSLEDVVRTQNNQSLFSCHLARKTDMTKDDMLSGAIKICRGYIASSTKSGITFDNGTDIAEGLKILQALVIEEDKEASDAILSKDEFINHHNRSFLEQEIDLSADEYNRRRGFR